MADSPAAALREAADHMREHHGPGHPRHVFWHRLAVWLDEEAAHEFAPDPDPALAVARAYLDGVR